MCPCGVAAQAVCVRCHQPRCVNHYFVEVQVNGAFYTAVTPLGQVNLSLPPEKDGVWRTAYREGGPGCDWCRTDAGERAVQAADQLVDALLPEFLLRPTVAALSQLTVGETLERHVDDPVPLVRAAFGLVRPNVEVLTLVVTPSGLLGRKISVQEVSRIPGFAAEVRSYRKWSLVITGDGEILDTHPLGFGFNGRTETIRCVVAVGGQPPRGEYHPAAGAPRRFSIENGVTPASDQLHAAILMLREIGRTVSTR